MRWSTDTWLEPLLPDPIDDGSRTDTVSGWPWWWAAVGWIVAAAASGGLAAAAIGSGADRDGVVRLMAGQIGLWAVFVATAVVASKRYGSGRVGPDFGLAIGVGDAARAFGIGVIVQLLVLPLLYLPLIVVGVNLDVAEPAEALFRDRSPAAAMAIAVGAMVAAPVVEELLFRGVLLRGLADGFGRGPAIWLSAGLFAGTHFQVVQFVGLFVFGAILAWLATRTGTVGAPLWAHVGFNTTTIVLLALRAGVN